MAWGWVPRPKRRSYLPPFVQSIELVNMPSYHGIVGLGWCEQEVHPEIPTFEEGSSGQASNVRVSSLPKENH